MSHSIVDMERCVYIMVMDLTANVDNDPCAPFGGGVFFFVFFFFFLGGGAPVTSLQHYNGNHEMHRNEATHEQNKYNLEWIILKPMIWIMRL